MCENCGKETKNPKFCSSSCAAIINGHKFPKRFWVCKRCGLPNDRPSRRARYHKKCRIRVTYTGEEKIKRIRLLWKGWYNKNAAKKKAWVAAREYKKLNQQVENVNREVVFQRDKGICQLKITSDCPTVLDHNNWHLDHIIPIALGGENSYINIQASCPKCNWAKGKRLLATVV